MLIAFSIYTTSYGIGRKPFFMSVFRKSVMAYRKAIERCIYKDKDIRANKFTYALYLINLFMRKRCISRVYYSFFLPRGTECWYNIECLKMSLNVRKVLRVKQNKIDHIKYVIYFCMESLSMFLIGCKN